MATTTHQTTNVLEKKKDIMSKAEFDRIKAKILQNKLVDNANDPASRLQKMALQCVQDVKERLAYITKRREERALAEEEKILSFASALAERNAVKDAEKSTRQGYKAFRTRIEGWRDEVKAKAMVQFKTLDVQQPRNPAKRPLDVTSSSPFDNTSLKTPVNKRIKTTRTTAQDPSSSSAIAAPPTSSKRSIPWLSTRASVDNENVFEDHDHAYPDQEIRLNDNKKVDDDDEQEDADEYTDDEEDDDDDGDDLFSEGSYLTQQEQLLAVELAMVGVMTVVLPQLIEQRNG
ncbi:hypothetical protein E4T39_08831 [Aureobasidium subglaciale]|nr:hypothetical protein E4T39_08831 [Aureobasidium subglaciale]